MAWNMESTHKKRKLNQDEIPRITYKWVFFAGTLLKYPTWGILPENNAPVYSMIFNKEY
jgi:hypothetical protein